MTAFERIRACLGEAARLFQKPTWLGLLLGAVTFVLFAPAIRCEFVDYDDGVYAFENPQVCKGINAESLAYAFRSIDGGSWMPLTWLSLMLDTTLFGSDSGGYHLTNIILHSASAGLLLLALARMTGRIWLSTLVAAGFAMHPLRTESVVWIAERKDVLSAFFWMVGLLAYVRYATSANVAASTHKRPQSKGRLGRWTTGRRWLWITFAMLVLGLMSKPMAVTFPFVLLLLDFWPLGRAGRTREEFQARIWPLVREKIPLFLLVACACVFTFRTQDRVGAVRHREISVFERSQQIASNYAFYVQKFFVPAYRTVVYPQSKLGPVLAGGVVLAFGTLSVWLIWRAFARPWLVVGWFWFLGTLVPVTGIVRIGSVEVSDRYSYLPSIGLNLLVMWGVAQLIPKVARAQRTAAVFGFAIIAGFACLTRADLARWKDSESLFESAARNAPHKTAFTNLAYFQIKRGEYKRAVENLNRAIELDANYGASYGTRALAYAWLDDYEQAKRDYDMAVKLGDRPIQPARAKNVLLGVPEKVPLSNDPEEAWHLFAGVFGLQPRTAESFRGRADIRVKVGDVTGSLLDYNKAIELRPDDPDLRTARGNAYVRLNDWTNALPDMTRAIELSPTNATSFQNRAVVYYRMGDYAKAWVDIKQCLKLGGKPHGSFIEALTEAEQAKGSK